MNKAIFLDRDGVVLEETGHYNFKAGHLNFVNGIVEALTELKSKGYLFIIITNQGGIAKRKYTKADVKFVHKAISEFFTEFGIKIKDILYCPHHDVVGKCLCRKPDSLMLEKAMAMYDIDPTKSYFIGDQERDIIAGEKAELESIKINPNDNLCDYLDMIK